MKIFVTGASGLVGSHLITKLASINLYESNNKLLNYFDCLLRVESGC